MSLRSFISFEIGNERLTTLRRYDRQIILRRREKYSPVRPPLGYIFLSISFSNIGRICVLFLSIFSSQASLVLP